MIQFALLAVLGAEQVPLSISIATQESGRWCAGPILNATVKNVGRKPLWLDLGKPSGRLEPISYFVSYWTDRGGGGSDGTVIGTTHDWVPIEYLRGPQATLLRPGEVAIRSLKLGRVRLRTAQVSVSVTVRIHGTDNLNESRVRTFEPEATADFGLRRRGACFEVRRLTSR